MSSENWMGQLPESVKNLSIIYLAIPGSHNSMTYGITKKSKIAPDAEPIIRKVNWVFPCIVRRWAITQSVDVTEQLKLGIRYLDLRVCTKNETEFYFAHGVYAMEITGPLKEVKSFLDSHPSEVVILDFQHFYELTDAHHKQLHYNLKIIFGDKLFGTKDGELKDFTLNECFARKKQLIVIYRSCPIALPDVFWGSYFWQTPWPNVCSTKKLKSFLTESLRCRTPSIGYVSQCVLTPSSRYILLRSFSSLRNVAKKVDKNLGEWILSQRPGEFNSRQSPTANTIIADFVQLKDAQFCQWVIGLNSLLDCETS